MGLARIAIAVLAVVVAFGLLVIGGIALWGALTSKDGEKPGGATSAPSGGDGDGKTRSSGSAGRTGNTIVIHCLAAQCRVFVSGPGPNDVQFNSTLGRGDSRIFNGTRLTMAVGDASTVAVTINGRLQPKGRRGEAKTFEVPTSQ